MEGTMDGVRRVPRRELGGGILSRGGELDD